MARALRGDERLDHRARSRAVGGLVRVVGHHWWPLIPGGILATIGAALLIGSEAVALLDYWWVVLIAAGVILIWQGWARSRPRE